MSSVLPSVGRWLPFSSRTTRSLPTANLYAAAAPPAPEPTTIASYCCELMRVHSRVAPVTGHLQSLRAARNRSEYMAHRADAAALRRAPALPRRPPGIPGLQLTCRAT